MGGKRKPEKCTEVGVIANAIYMLAVIGEKHTGDLSILLAYLTNIITLLCLKTANYRRLGSTVRIS